MLNERKLMFLKGYSAGGHIGIKYCEYNICRIWREIIDTTIDLHTKYVHLLMVFMYSISMLI